MIIKNIFFVSIISSLSFSGVINTQTVLPLEKKETSRGIELKKEKALKAISKYEEELNELREALMNEFEDTVTIAELTKQTLLHKKKIVSELEKIKQTNK